MRIKYIQLLNNMTIPIRYLHSRQVKFFCSELYILEIILKVLRKSLHEVIQWQDIQPVPAWLLSASLNCFFTKHFNGSDYSWSVNMHKLF